MRPENLLHPLPATDRQEHVETLLERPHCRVERIVSHHHVSPPDFWYDQEEDEWVVLLEGEATLQFEKPAQPVVLVRGDSLLIPAHCRHRVTRTSSPTVWLTVWLPAKV